MPPSTGIFPYPFLENYIPCLGSSDWPCALSPNSRKEWPAQHPEVGPHLPDGWVDIVPQGPSKAAPLEGTTRSDSRRTILYTVRPPRCAQLVSALDAIFAAVALCYAISYAFQLNALAYLSSRQLFTRQSFQSSHNSSWPTTIALLQRFVSRIF